MRSCIIINKAFRFISIFVYKYFAQYLPESSHSISSRIIRSLLGKLIIEKSGKNINIERCANFSWRIELGNNSGIGVNAKLFGKVIIGDNVMIGPNCIIYTKNHKHERIDIPMCLQGESEECPVIIGNDVWIGTNVIILPGITIGNGTIIGAGSVVTKNIPDFVIAAGNPAIVKKERK